MKMTTATSFHKSNFGSFSGGFRADIDGYVHLTTEAVMGGNWDTAGGEMDEDMASEIAEHNRDAVEANEAALNEWRKGS